MSNRRMPGPNGLLVADLLVVDDQQISRDLDLVGVRVRWQRLLVDQLRPRRVGHVQHAEGLPVQVGDEKVIALLVDAKAVAVAGEVVVADQAQVVRSAPASISATVIG